jgi:hypothetical protein
MNYQKIYNLLIQKAKNRNAIDGYKESHHILPRCMGGSDEPENLVDLTAKEHFVAHFLLAKIHNNSKLWVAVLMMKGKKGRIVNGKLYEIAKKQRSLHMKGNQNAKGAVISESTRIAVAQANKKRGFTDVMREKCTFKNKKHTEEHKQYMKQIMTKRLFSEETRQKMSDAQKKRWQANKLTKEIE